MYYQIAMPYSTLFFIFFYVYYPYISDENKKTSDRSKKRMISFGIPSSLTVIIFYFSVCKLPAAFEAGPYTSISGLNSVYLFICFYFCYCYYCFCCYYCYCYSYCSYQCCCFYSVSNCHLYHRIQSHNPSLFLNHLNPGQSI